MLSVKNYSRLFRPWDVSQGETSEQNDINNELQKRKDEKRESRLRKIRGVFKKNDGNQDATVSTTTLEEKPKLEPSKQEISESPVASLTQCCDRLLQGPEEDLKTKQDTKPSDIYPLNVYPNISPANVYHGFVPDYMSDISQTLVPTDPILLESLAQGYAMELEYARILHQENEAKLLNARKQRPKKYKCPHCQVGFSNNGQLKGHIRIHTGERPYKCDEKNCGKTFTRNEELTRHKRIHSGVRPYPCSTCGKKFGRRDHLKKHTRTHLQAEMLPVFIPLSPHISGYPYLYGY